MLSEQQINKHLQHIQTYIKKDITQWIFISTDKQTLYLLEDTNILITYPVSTSKYGVGCEMGSYQTPIGVHTIAEKIGGDQVSNMIFKARKPIGKIAAINTQEVKEKDLITSRILWLTGEEPGINKNNNVDTYKRYIYIHGTANEEAIGSAVSIGCIRMFNKDVITLFNMVDIGLPVLIL